MARWCSSDNTARRAETPSMGNVQFIYIYIAHVKNPKCYEDIRSRNCPCIPHDTRPCHLEASRHTTNHKPHQSSSSLQFCAELPSLMATPRILVILISAHTLSESRHAFMAHIPHQYTKQLQLHAAHTCPSSSESKTHLPSYASLMRVNRPPAF